MVTSEVGEVVGWVRLLGEVTRVLPKMCAFCLNK